MRLLLTRPLSDAERSAATLAALGHQVELEPLLTIRYRPQAVELDGVQALLITSLNGLRAFLASSPRRDLPVLAVGPASAQAARAAGFASVRSAEGDAAALAELTLRTLDPEAGALFHPAGTVSAGGLSEPLVEAGFELRRQVLYDAMPAEGLSERTQGLLRDRALDGVLFYSPRTAAIFVELVREAGLERSCSDMTAYCLSAAVAKAAEPLGWRDLRVATAPQEPALIEVIGNDENRRTGSDGMADEDSRANVSREGEEAASAAENPAERLIARFGGLRPMAAKLGIAVSTVQGWKQRGHIPASRTEEIREAAAKHDIELEEAELAAATAEQPQGEAARPWGPVSDEAALPAESPGEASAETNEPVPGEGPAADEPAESSPAQDRLDGTEARAAAAPARRGAAGLIGGMLLGVLLVAAGAAAAVLTRQYWQPYLEAALPGLETRVEEALDPLRARIEALESAPTQQAGIEPLEQDLAALRERVAALEQQPAPTAGEGADLADLQQRVERLEARPGAGGEGGEGEAATGALENLRQEVAALDERLAAAGADPQALEGFRSEVAQLTARFQDVSGTIESLRQAMARTEVVQEELGAARNEVEDLQQRVEELSGRVEENAQAAAETTDRRSRGALLALALGQLREALRLSAPYAEELQSVRAVAEDGELDELIQPLEAGAESGVPTLAELRRRFAELAPEVVGASYASGEQGWMREVMERIPELVTVRPVGQAEGDGPGAKVARAERALADNDLAAAVEEVASLEGEAAEAVAPWLEQARARLAVDEALSALTRQAIGQLSGAQVPASGTVRQGETGEAGSSQPGSGD